MFGLKIATLGGGSSYTPELVEGLIQRREHLPVRELWFVDIPEGREKLEIVGGLAQLMVAAAGLPLAIHTTLDREAALEGADYVTTQIRVGQLDARVLDERIPLEHGIIGQETNGAGGMFKAFRTIPVIFDIIRDMERLCPDAWLVNFANPAGIITEAVLRYTGWRKIIGLCNVPINMHHGFARLLDVAPEQLRMELAGVNHFVYATDVFVDGRSRFRELIRIYEKISAEDIVAMKNFVSRPFSPALIRGLGSIPCPYHSYYYFTQEELAAELEQLEAGTTRAEVVQELERDLFALYRDPELQAKPEQLARRGGARYSDAACNLIASLHNDTGDIQYVDTQNNGAMRTLPDEAVIEAACVITAAGPKPLAIGTPPPQIDGPIQQMKAFERLVAAAAVSGDRDLAITALNTNPLCPSDTVAVRVVDALLAAHRDYLPQFS